MENRLILLGGGGHCKSCIDVIEKESKYLIAGILDPFLPIGSDVLGYPVVGGDDDIEHFVSLGYSFIITLGQVKSALTREKIYNALTAANATIATIISPHALVSKHALIGKGTIVMHHVTINAAVKVGNNCILNTGCNVEHDVVIGNHVHLSTHSNINGDCVVGDSVFIGSGTTVFNSIKINAETIIGAGSVVVKAIREKGVYIGNPAKKIK